MPSPSRLTLCTLLTVTPLAAQATRSPELISVTTADLPTLRNTPRATAPESVIGGAGVRSFAVSPAGVIVVDNGERQLRVIAPDAHESRIAMRTSAWLASSASRSSR